MTLELQILHITNDEKFLKSAIVQFSNVKGCKSTFLLPIVQLEESKFISSEIVRGKVNVLCEPYGTKEYYNLIFNSGADLVFVHGLSMAHKSVILKIKNKFKVLWLSWGRDLYTTGRLNHLMYKSQTRKLLVEHDTSKTLRKRIGRIVYFFLRAKNRIPKDSANYLSRIDYMSTVVKEDYEALAEAYPQTKNIKYIPFNYHGFARANISGTEQSIKKDILVGNSANPENNHLECFYILSKVNLGKRKVIVPLSYGGNTEYIKAVLSEGERLLGENFIPLKKFLKKEEYSAILDKIGIALMNHSHQHAMGNIWQLLCQSTKVFMDFDNSAAKALLRLGVSIYDKDNFITEFDKPLDEEIALSNKAKIIAEYGDEAVLKRTQEFVDFFIQELKC